MNLGQPVLEGVAGHHRLAKFSTVNRHEIDYAGHIRLAGMQTNRPGSLRHTLDDQDTGHDRPTGEMTCKKGFVDCHILYTGGGVVSVNIDDAINQQKRIPMRQKFENLANVDRFENWRFIPHLKNFTCLHSFDASFSRAFP